MKSVFRFNVPGAVLLLMLLALWQLNAVRVASNNVPDLFAIAAAFQTTAPALFAELARSLARAMAGLAIAVPTMIVAGLIIGRVKPIAYVFLPIIDLLRPLPPIAIAPVAMLFAGTGTVAKIAVIAYGCAFPVLINTIDAVRASHPLLSLVAASNGLNARETMLLVDLPAALPRILVGVRTSVALCLLISITSEMILSSDGLGNLIVIYQQRFQIAEEFAAIAMIVGVGVLISTAWSALDRKLIGWHYGYLERNK
jgi:ABC-type nitrate/sulfonate/bicarbonate transport system permease component